MVKMTGGQALAKSLYREGVRVIFGLPDLFRWPVIQLEFAEDQPLGCDLHDDCSEEFRAPLTGGRRGSSIS